MEKVIEFFWKEEFVEPTLCIAIIMLTIAIIAAIATSIARGTFAGIANFIFQRWKWFAPATLSALAVIWIFAI